ncbi:hypothetical protein FLONG3_4253 [Fusarium longipes]|uniref:Bacteriophage T5 Orf172 DNA-binding domain-containing protein n=1 Tax=Fusarium longipes TaxID=694270 RepID=A0A395SZ40_9HYPO|nr:hypothetical protein FLONG3_4253 [Fusarium longipes]
MNPNDDSSLTLSSLYKAIGLDVYDTFYCFARAENGKCCPGAVPTRRSKDIKPLLQKLASCEIGNEDPITVQMVERTLAELAGKLVCYNPIISHAVKFELGGKRYKDNREYVYFLLTSKFKTWQLERQAKDQRNKGQHTSTRAHRKSLAQRQDDAITLKDTQSSDEDTYDSSYEDDEEADEEADEETDEETDQETDEEETSDEDVPVISKSRKLQRPKLARESRQGARDIFVTPVRRRRFRNCIRAAEESFQSPSYPSSSDDDSTFSPGSVTSPAPSEVFSPLSVISTPGSLASTAGFESRRSSFRAPYKMRQNASSIGRADLANIDALSRDMRQKLNLSVSIPNQEGDSGDESGPGMWSENTESDEEAVARPMMKLVLRSKPLRELLDLMGKPIGKTSSCSGWIYGFADPSIEGHIKIGYAVNSVEERMKQWRVKCGYRPEVKFEVSMPCAVRRMEGLVHKTLHMEAKDVYCPDKSCRTKHREWFKISETEAEKVVRIWQKFSESQPYTESRQLSRTWEGIAATQETKPWSSDTKEWLRKGLRKQLEGMEISSK